MLVEYTTDTTIADWVDRWFKPQRLNREPDTRDNIIASKEFDIAQYGETLISHHDAVTGATVWLLDRTERTY